MSNVNIFEPIVNSLSEVGKLSLKLLYKLMNIKTYFDIENFFKTVELKNKAGLYPRLIKIYSSKKGYIFLMSCPIGLGVSNFLKEKEALEIQLKKSITIKNNNGFIEIEVIEVELPTLINYQVPNKIKDSVCIPIANSIDKTIYIDFKDETPHVLITGTTGSGKSVTLKSLLVSILNLYSNEIIFILIDFKIVELAQFKKLKQTKAYVNDIEGAKEVIADALEECKRRYSLFEKYDVTNIYDYNKKVSPDKKLKYEFIVVEEFVMLLSDKKKVAMNMLKQLACLSRASGQFLIITGQRFDNTIIDLVLRANIGARLCHKVESENDSKLIIDSLGAESLNGNGHMIFKQGCNRIECQSYYISDSKVKQLTEKYIVKNKAIQEPCRKYESNKDTLVKNQKETCLKLNLVTNETNNIKDNKEPNTITDLSFIDKL